MFLAGLGHLRGTWEPGSHKILDLTGNLEEYLPFVTFIAKYVTIWGEISRKSPVGSNEVRILSHPVPNVPWQHLLFSLLPGSSKLTSLLQVCALPQLFQPCQKNLVWFIILVLI